MDIDIPSTLRAMFDALAAKLRSGTDVDGPIDEAYARVSMLIQANHYVRLAWMTDLTPMDDADA